MPHSLQPARALAEGSKSDLFFGGSRIVPVELSWSVSRPVPVSAT